MGYPVKTERVRSQLREGNREKGEENMLMDRENGRGNGICAKKL